MGRGGPAPSVPSQGWRAEGRWTKARRAGTMTFARVLLAAAAAVVSGTFPAAGASQPGRSAPSVPQPRSPPPLPLQHHQPGGGGCPRGGGRFVNVTESGAECLPWADVPTFLERTPQGRGLRGQRNFCRNPDGRSRPWCFYRNSHGRVDWGYCDCRQGEPERPAQGPRARGTAAERGGRAGLG